MLPARRFPRGVPVRHGRHAHPGGAVNGDRGPSALGNPTGPFGIRGAFDVVTGRIGVSLDDGGADQTFGTIAASGATIVAATTAPTVDNSGDDHLMAAGNGIVMAISLDNGGTPWCVTSAKSSRQ